MYGAIVDVLDPADHLEEHCLPCAVRSDKTDLVSRAQEEIPVVEYDALAKGDADVGEVYHSLAPESGVLPY